MVSASERLDRNERRNSLAAFLRAIRFQKPEGDEVAVERHMARLHPRARQHGGVSEDSNWVRSAN